MFKTKWQRKYEKLYSYVNQVRNHCEDRANRISEESELKESIIAQKVILNDILKMMKYEMES